MYFVCLRVIVILPHVEASHQSSTATNSLEKRKKNNEKKEQRKKLGQE